MALMQFKEFALQQLGIEHMWRITDHHVQAWIVWMTGQDLAKRTIGQRLAALSSYFDYSRVDHVYARRPRVQPLRRCLGLYPPEPVYLAHS